MTIDLNGITSEQLRLERSKIRYDLENLEPGQGCWTSSEAVWADSHGATFLDLSYGQYEHEEVVSATGNDAYDSTEDYVYVFYAVEGGFIVSATHIPNYRPCGITTPKKELVASSQPVIGIIYDDVMLSFLNAETFGPEYGVTIPHLLAEQD